jgi:hypothetical protein
VSHRWGASLIAALMGLSGCARSPAPSTPSEAPASAPATQAERERFGEAVPEGDALPLAQVLADPDAHLDAAILVEGHVRRVCQRKGCWMELAAEADDHAPRCRVTFQDYGFFVPTDADGARARLHGRIEIDTVPADHVAHLESEGAQFEDKREDGTAREVRLVATGVELRR